MQPGTFWRPVLKILLQRGVVFPSLGYRALPDMATILGSGSFLHLEVGHDLVPRFQWHRIIQRSVHAHSLWTHITVSAHFVPKWWCLAPGSSLYVCYKKKKKKKKASESSLVQVGGPFSAPHQSMLVFWTILRNHDVCFSQTTIVWKVIEHGHR